MSNNISKILFKTKIPRYVHMAKHHQMRGELGEAEYYFNLLAEARQQTLGDTDPSLATVSYELARLNHRDEVPHTPDVQVIYNSLGRGSQVYLFYKAALDIRAAALGENHPAYAESLYGLATFFNDNSKTSEAIPMLKQALAVQKAQPDNLPAALSFIALGDALHVEKQTTEWVGCYKEALERLPYPGDALLGLEAAEKLCGGGSGGDSVSVTVDVDNIQRALQLQRKLADSYFSEAFEVFSDRSVELLAIMLELHRQQYRLEYRYARAAALQKLAQSYRERGEMDLAIPLLEEAATLQTESV
jgi:tetratricopeptide (TPR) repeat protein